MEVLDALDFTVRGFRVSGEVLEDRPTFLGIGCRGRFIRPDRPGRFIISFDKPVVWPSPISIEVNCGVATTNRL
jgi:hypothetical protein